MTQKVLITGATGLLGRQVVKAFQRKDWEVISTGFTRASSSILKLDLNSKSSIADILSSTKYASLPSISFINDILSNPLAGHK